MTDDASTMTDNELVFAAKAMDDFDHLSSWEQRVIEEMERRGILD